MARMTTNGPASDGRLDSWKAIADYLGRDVGTARRWERHQGLPVRRVPGGRGSSVFAYTSEIDEWLKRSGPAVVVAAPPAAPPAGARQPFQRPHWAVVPLGLAVVVVLAWRGTAEPPPSAVPALRAEISKESVTAFDDAGRELWKHRFDPQYDVVLSEFSPGVMLAPGEAAVHFSTGYREHRLDRRIEGGELTALTAAGRRLWSFAFDDVVNFGSKPFAAPWAITTFAIERASTSRRIAVASHHYVWGPSLVAVLDPAGHRLGTFAHSGWIEALRWVSADRLLIAGFSESQNGGMVALVDPGNLNGQGPETPGGRHYCNNCGQQGPVRMMVMPRSELNLATNSRFNRAAISVVGDRVVVHTLEVPSTSLASDAVYEFTMELEPIKASFSQHYWETHAALQAEGKLDHSRDQCPDREGPRHMRSWRPATGWTDLTLP